MLKAKNIKLKIKEKYNKLEELYSNVQQTIINNKNLLSVYENIKKNNILQMCQQNLENYKKDFNNKKQITTSKSTQSQKSISNTYNSAKTNNTNQYEQTKDQINNKYKIELLDIKNEFKDMEEEYPSEYLSWSNKYFQTFTPVIHIKTPLTRIGELTISYKNQAISVPALLRIITSKNVLFQVNGHSKKNALSAIQSIILRLLATIPPGKLKLMIMDPVGLGSNMAGFKHLPEEIIIGDKIFTTSKHIEEQLDYLSTHIENIVQNYLLNIYKNFEEYNKKAGDVTKAYRFLIVVDFPANFNEDTAQKLLSIAKVGPERGVYVIILHDTDLKLPHNFNIKELESLSTIINYSGKDFFWQDPTFINYPLKLDSLPSNGLFNQLVNQIGEKAKLLNSVKIPFDLGYKDLDEYWCLKSGEVLSVPIGRTGPRNMQFFTLGLKTQQHAFAGGQTGAGKSNLLHVLIMSLCLNYSPEELELYLIDCKRVEFTTYAKHKLPHAKVVSTNSEREFVLSVFRRLDQELKHRMDLFSNKGLNHINSFRLDFPDQLMPRIILLVDEFQEIFTIDDDISTECNAILDRLVRQARAFGIHVVLVSQDLYNQGNFNKNIVDQMAVRIALKLPDQSYGILSDDNNGHKHLSKQGEAIYNDDNGSKGGNHFFQIFFLSDDERDKKLQLINQKTKAFHKQIEKNQVIFDGKEISKIDTNNELKKYMEKDNEIIGRQAPVKHWIGETVSIGPPLHATFKRQAQANLLILGQNEESAFNMMITSMISIASQLKPDDLEINIINLIKLESEYNNKLKNIHHIIPHKLNMYDVAQIEDAIESINTIYEERDQDSNVNEKQLLIYIIGLHQAKKLKSKDGYSFSDSAEKLQTIITEGPDFGIHTICWSDTLKNVEKILDRKILSEFDMRIAFKVARYESENLIDSSDAAILKEHFALFYDEERVEKIIKFKPYSTPSEDLLNIVKNNLLKKYNDENHNNNS